MFTQNADGLMDCSVWAMQSEFEETASPGGGIFMTHRQVWKPVRFGPCTLRQHEMGEALHRRLCAAVNDPSFSARVAGLFRR